MRPRPRYRPHCGYRACQTWGARSKGTANTECGADELASDFVLGTVVCFEGLRTGEHYFMMRTGIEV